MVQKIPGSNQGWPASDFKTLSDNPAVDGFGTHLLLGCQREFHFRIKVG